MKFKAFLVLVFVLFASQVCASWTECGFISVGEDQIKVAHDLSGMPVGDHSILVKAYNLWEETDPVPFDFERQSPALPINMRLTDSVGE